MKNRWKKVVAIGMVFTIILSNMGISANGYVRAEGISSSTSETTSEESKEDVTTETVTTQSEKEETAAGEVAAQNETTTTENEIIQSNLTKTAANETVTTQSGTTKDSSEETLKIPTILLNGVAIDSVSECKEGAEISITSSDCDSDSWIVKIFDSSSNEIKVYDGINEKTRVLKEGTSFKFEKEKYTIKFYYGEDEKVSKELNRFSNYTYTAMIGNDSYSINEDDITLEGTNDINKVELEKTYKVNNLNGFTISDSTNVIFTSVQKEVVIKAESIVKPKITIDNDQDADNPYYINDEIEISVDSNGVNTDLWTSMYYELNGTKKEITSSNNKYKLTFSEHGQYEIYMETTNGKAQSNSIKPVVYSKVEFADNYEWKSELQVVEDIYYTNESKIDIVCDFQSDDLEVNGSLSLYNSEYKDLKLVLSGELDSDKLKPSTEWRNFTIQSAKVTNGKEEQIYYKLDDLLSEENKDVKLYLEIKKPDLLVRPENNELAISYRTNAIRWEKSRIIIFQMKDNIEQTLTNEKKNCYQNILSNEANLESTCSKDNILTITDGKLEKTDIRENTYYVKDCTNFNLWLEKNTFGVSETVPEKIEDYKIRDYINMTYMNKNLTLTLNKPQEENRVGIQEIITTINDKNESYNKAYPKVCYRKQSAETVSNRDSINMENTTETLKPSFDENENIIYYDLIFSDKLGIYPAVAAVIRIVRESYLEDLKEKNESYTPETVITDADGRVYQVINLFYNDKDVSISFEDNNLDTDVNWNNQGENIRGSITPKLISCNKEQKITFTLTGAKEERTVQYGYINLENVTNFTATNLKKLIPKSETLKDIKEINSQTTNASVLANYEVETPDKQGDYAFYIKVTNKQGVSQNYVSNGFVIDTEPPILNVTFKNNQDEGKIEGITDKERIYLQEDEIRQKVSITDDNSVTTKILITAKDSKGEDVEGTWKIVGSNQQEIETKEIVEDGNTYVEVYEKEFNIIYSKHANYTVKMTSKDFSTNKKDDIRIFTMDKNKPTGSITVDGKKGKIDKSDDKDKGLIKIIEENIKDFWDKFVENVTYKWFNKEIVSVELTGEDDTTNTTQYYYIAEEELNLETLEKLDSKKWKKYDGSKVEVPVNKKNVIYGMIEDEAGNKTFINTEGILTDTGAPEITITPNIQKNANGFYNTDITYSVNIKDITDAIEDYSGLQYVAYTISNNGEVTQSKVIYESTDQKIGKKSKDFNISVDASTNNSNNVTVNVVAVDKAGNMAQKEEDIQIDKVKPEITVTYDNNQSVNGNYYNKTRTATIQIKERNLDTKDISLDIASTEKSKVSVGKWTHTNNIGKSDDAIYECKVIFSEDDDYTFSVSCIDKAGNKCKEDYNTKFTVDTKVPVVEVSYSGADVESSEYVNQQITATITVTEHNFNTDDVSVNVEAENAGAKPSVSGFRSENDKHTATVHFDTDGTYQLSVSYSDKAGNSASDYEGNRFVVDLTQPEIQIKNLENHLAYKDEVKPVITFTDKNYDESRISLNVVGSNNGNMKLETLKAVKSSVKEGVEYALEFPKESAIDDLYTLTATIEDKAGNKVQEVVEFSVNRYGSVYTLGDATDEWLDSGVCSYLMEERSIVIIETNVNGIASRSISYSLGGVNGTTVNISEFSECTQEEKSKNQYYTVTKNEQNNGWVQYRYEIQAENFEKEGIYNITIHSKDSVGNETSNISNLHSDNKLAIQFAVDKTVPNIVFSGVEEDELYKENEHTVLVDVQDNIALEQVTVYLNGEEYGNYSAEDIQAYDDGLLTITVPQSTSKQTVQVAAKDMAGNMIGDVSADIAGSDCEEISFLVTTNKFVQYIHSTWLLIISGIVLLIIAGGIVLFVFRTRRKNK